MHHEQPDTDWQPSVVELEQLRRAQGAPGVPRPFATIVRSGTSQETSAALMGAYGLIVLVAGAQAINVAADSAPPWWSYVPAGVSAVVATTTFVITFALWRRGATDRAREQASKVFVSTSRTHNADGSIVMVARVHNQSDIPIWGVEVHPRRDGSTYNAPLTQSLPDVLPLDHVEFSWSVPKAFAPAESNHPRLVFVDGAERRWKREGLSLTRD